MQQFPNTDFFQTNVHVRFVSHRGVSVLYLTQVQYLLLKREKVAMSRCVLKTKMLLLYLLDVKIFVEKLSGLLLIWMFCFLLLWKLI